MARIFLYRIFWIRRPLFKHQTQVLHSPLSLDLENQGIERFQFGNQIPQRAETVDRCAIRGMNHVTRE